MDWLWRDGGDADGPSVAVAAMTLYTLSQESDTEALAQALAAKHHTLPPVMTLEGPLGVGKTTFMRFYLNALGWKGPVISPTYGLIQVYDLPAGPLWHVDCYRLGDPEDIYALGLVDAMMQHACCIEWPQRIAPFLPPVRQALTFDFKSDQTRRVRHEWFGLGGASSSNL
ncbi:MAG: tRNA (adenosine(37)-N6)-threonylcarbamoyltransferase complex ATPase subunit type 1 TsaE [Alphaproteobacteria bacterium]